ncbi:MAG TPA: formyltetrahydrofolate deformylase [Gammaproteobacteria bacterium]|nr:formyltetrahydrofolate deformylase [Gammaproteobacteria bacterium]
MKNTYRIIFDCPDRRGIVAKTATMLSDNGGWILDAAHHSDHDHQWFFSRLEVKADSLPFDLSVLREKFQPLVDEFEMNLRLVDGDQPKRVVILASKSSHCLADLLDRWHSNDIDCDICAVISNHCANKALVEGYDIPYHEVMIDKDDKAPGFAELERLIDRYDAETIVLARYMQILPPAMCHKYQHQVINIHHSFLPSFVGAGPYRQAWQRGVKLVGATSHYVTEHLDQGPIIAQDTIHVSHAHTARDLVRLGKDVEKTVLARGLTAHLEDRVMVHGNRTIVFD